MTGTNPPLRLQVDADIQKSIIHELVIPKGTSMIGTRYRLGANNDHAVDCSALIQQMYRRAGLKLPRVTRQMIAVGEPVARSALKPGDLLFYRWKKHERQLHVAIYVGEGYVLHASVGHHKVVMKKLNQIWRDHLVTVRRVLQTQAASLMSTRSAPPTI